MYSLRGPSGPRIEGPDPRTSSVHLPLVGGPEPTSDTGRKVRVLVPEGGCRGRSNPGLKGKESVTGSVLVINVKRKTMVLHTLSTSTLEGVSVFTNKCHGVPVVSRTVCRTRVFHKQLGHLVLTHLDSLT